MIESVLAFLTGFLLLAGAMFMTIAALGLVRMPDLPTRMHATTKAGALGGGLMVLSVAFHFSEPDIVARAIAVVVFIILTAPVAAHIIGRAGYFVGVPLWEGTIKDELHDRYDDKTHVLHSREGEAEPKAEGEPPSAE